MWRRVRDDLERALVLDAPPRRIVSLVPSLTELVCDLGAGDRLIAVTRFCTEPAARVAALPRVGGTKTPRLEQILALRPDLVLVNAEENQRDDFDRLLTAGVPVFVSFPRSVAAVVDGIRRLGIVLEADAPAAALAARIEAARRALAPRIAPAARVFCPIWRRPYMSFNRDTYCDDLLACAGGANLCAAAATRYPVVELAEIAAADPQVILLPDEPYPFAERHLASLAPLHTSSAWRAGRVHLVDGKALSWYGRRTPDALRLFHALLHPERALPDSS